MSAHEPARHAKEIELKFELDPADAARIAPHPLLRDTLVPPEQRNLVSIYFDTADFALRKAGVYLRVRDTGTGYVQTVKSMRSEAEPMERLEWERQITSSRPELEHAEGTALAPLLTPEVRASLRQLFATVVERRTYLVASGDSEIEVALDRGEILSGEGRRPISELELELKRGATRDLFSLARTFAQALPLRLAVKTKAERGYELVGGGTHEVEKAANIDIKPGLIFIGPKAQQYGPVLAHFHLWRANCLPYRAALSKLHTWLAKECSNRRTFLCNRSWPHSFSKAC